jgi:hypothetical protein
MVRPDPIQPRRVLPEYLHAEFHAGRMTPTQALKGLVQIVQVSACQRWTSVQQRAGAAAKSGCR